MRLAKIIYFIFAIIFIFASIIIYAILFFSSTYDINWGSILVLLIPAKILFVFGIIFFALFISFQFNTGRQYETKSLYKIFTSVLSVSLVLCTVFAIKGYKSDKLFWYSNEEKEHYAEIEKYLPYNDLFQLSSDSSDVLFEVSKTFADCGIKDICAVNIIKDSSYYETEYFESRDIFLNRKFIVDRTVESIFNDGFVDVEADPIFGEFDGINYKLYVQDGNYALAIGDKSHAFYTTLVDIDSFDISTEMFIKTAIEQYRLMQNASKLDIYDY